MGTVASPTILDIVASRTAGEAWTLNAGSLTIRTDTRVSGLNSPASNTGSLGSVTINEGDLIWDSTNIRWMPYNSGTGNVPAFGTAITQGAVSGYLLGVWASITSLPTAAGAAMPATGFIKFREVTGGNFTAGALTGIGASATGPDVQGWAEIAFDAGANITVPRLGKHTARGGKFFLSNTTGVRGQVFQIPTMGSAAMFAPGLYVETDVADQYEFVPALNGATNGWASMHLGNATGTTDARQKFLKAVAGGQMVMGETSVSASMTYASLAAQAGTYVGLAYSATYTWVNDVVEVYCSSGHLLETGRQTGLDFTSGSATDGIYTVTVLDPYHFTVPLAGSGVPGAVTIRPGITVSFTAHGLNVGESTYCDFTSGTGIDGTYPVVAVWANSYQIAFPHVAAITSGNVSCLHSFVITWTAHGFAQGQTFYIDFTSGVGVDGVYVAKTIATNTITINHPHSVAQSAVNCTLARDIGYVYPAGRKTWIPSNILTEVATGARATNTIPNATQASRPEWTTTSAGALDLEYVYGTSGYLNVSQPYSVRLKECVFFDSSLISECATALDIDGLHHGMHSALDVVPITFSYCYAGGTVKNVKAPRGNTPGTSDHAVSIVYCKGITFDDVEGSIVQYARSTGNAINVATSSNCAFNRPRALNNTFNISGSPGITINNLDYCERMNGHGLGAASAISADANCNNLKVDGMTYGLGFTVPNQQPNRLLYTIGCSNVKLRNCGSLASPLPLPTWALNLSAIAYLYQSGGANDNVKVQKVFAAGVKTAPFATANSDKNMLYETVQCGNYAWALKTLMTIVHADLNGTIKNTTALESTTGQASVYGTHFRDAFLGFGYGRLVLMCNEPSAETLSVFSPVTGTPKWNSAGGCIIPQAWDAFVWETPYFIKGHTGFLSLLPTMSGGTLSNYRVEYQIDLGSGYSDWKPMYDSDRISITSITSGQYTFTIVGNSDNLQIGDRCWAASLPKVGEGLRNALIPKITNIAKISDIAATITVDQQASGSAGGALTFSRLPTEVVDPSIGFKIKIKITSKISSSTAVTFLSIPTLSTQAAQDNYYDLDLNTVTFTGLPVGCDAVVLSAGTTTILDQKDSLPGTSYAFQYSGSKTVDVGFIKAGYTPFYIRALSLTTADSSIPVSLTPDRNYQ